MLNLTLIQYYVNEYEMNNVWELKKGEKKHHNERSLIIHLLINLNYLNHYTPQELK